MKLNRTDAAASSCRCLPLRRWPCRPRATGAAQAGRANPTAQATLLGQFGDWGAYTATPGGQKVCFALAKPTSSVDNPPNRRTAANAVYMFISTRPDEKVNNEVSLLVTGYAFKPNTEASVAVGGASFPMYTQNDGAWVKNAAEEAQADRRHAQGRRRGDQGHDLQAAPRPPTRSRSRAFPRRSTASRRSASSVLQRLRLRPRWRFCGSSTPIYAKTR